jgi:hypothetical protein
MKRIVKKYIILYEQFLNKKLLLYDNAYIITIFTVDNLIITDSERLHELFLKNNNIYNNTRIYASSSHNDKCLIFLYLKQLLILLMYTVHIMYT